MKRRLFTILSAMSLLLFVALGLLWVRSYWTCDSLARYGNLWTIGAISFKGQLGFGVDHYTNPPVRAVRDGWLALPIGPGLYVRTPGWDYLGFGGEDVGMARGGGGHTIFFIPHWIGLALSLILPVRWFRGWRRGRLMKLGHCITCGYDLRASKDRCPECGTPIVAIDAK